jgi:hypothetical protein
MDTLHIYEVASGQQINREKTTLFFSKSTSLIDQEAITQFLQVPVLRSYEKYLGLPSFLGRSKCQSFAYIKERVWSKLQGWKERLLSQAGREVLLKAVVQAVPTYAMSCFRLPDRLCHELEGLMRRFWWGHGADKRKICCVSWKKLCQPKIGGEWASMSSRNSTWLSWASRCGDFFMQRILYCTKSSKENFFLWALFWRPSQILVVLMLGIAFVGQNRLLSRVCARELVMVLR